VYVIVQLYGELVKKVIAAYPSFKQASYKIGLSAKVLQSRADSKTRIYSEYFQKDIAIRWGKLKEEDKPLIEKTHICKIIK
jgi:hypothetical protein